MLFDARAQKVGKGIIWRREERAEMEFAISLVEGEQCGGGRLWVHSLSLSES